MLRLISTLSSAALFMTACAKAPEMAEPEFSDALVYVLSQFDDDESELVFAILELEKQVYLNMDVDASNPQDRALTPERLQAEDVEELTRPDRDPAFGIPVALARPSVFEPDSHRHVQMLEDHTPVEPYSPDTYDRIFLDGQDCWLDRECMFLRTQQEIVKQNLLMTIPYSCKKDFRWVDLQTDNPVEEDPRWAFIARTWNEDSFVGETGKNSIVQSYSIEIWFPRDGRGFLRDGTEVNTNEGTWTSDSNGGGTLRLLSVWAETDLGGLDVSDDMVAATTRNGIDKNFKAVESWLEENQP